MADPKAMQKTQHLMNFALTVLLDRAGGSITFTEAEYEAILGKRGGRTMMVIHVEHVTLQDGQQAVRAVLVTKAPGQGELPA